MYHLDINNAFLLEKLDEEVYMLPREGYVSVFRERCVGLGSPCTGSSKPLDSEISNLPNNSLIMVSISLVMTIVLLLYSNLVVS